MITMESDDVTSQRSAAAELLSSHEEDEEEGPEVVRQHVVLNRYGNHDNVVTEDRTVPEPNNDQIQIKIHACSMNFSDMYTMRGMFRNPTTPKPPFVMGREGAGEVVKVGANVRDYQVGDRVACICKDLGLWAHYINVAPSQCISLPDEMSYPHAASFFVNYLTAYCCLFNFGNVKTGQKVFIHSVAGGVGCAATQLVKSVSGTVVGTASLSKHERLTALGVDHLIDSENPDYDTEVLSLFPEGVDIVLDNRSGADFGKGRKMLGQMGKIIHIGAKNMMQGNCFSVVQLLKTWWNLKNVAIFDLVMSNQAVCGFNLDVLRDTKPDILHAAVNDLKNMYRQNKLKPIIDSVFTFDKASDAVKHFEERKSLGKIILVPQ